MRKIKNVLRLRMSGGLSIRESRASTKISLGAIQTLLARAHQCSDQMPHGHWRGIWLPAHPERPEGSLSLSCRFV